MITKISESGIVTCEAYGFSPGRYPIEEFTADDLLTERRILAAYSMAHTQTSFALLDDQIARLIDQKCNEEERSHESC